MTATATWLSRQGANASPRNGNDVASLRRATTGVSPSFAEGIFVESRNPIRADLSTLGGRYAPGRPPQDRSPGAEVLAMSLSRFSFQYELCGSTPKPQTAEVLAGAILDAFRVIEPRCRIACDVHSRPSTVVLRGHIASGACCAEPADKVEACAVIEPDYVI